MTVPQLLVTVCFLALMALGVFVLIYSLIRLTRHTSPSSLSLPGIKIELRGPAWLVSAVVGTIMLASPVIAAALAKSPNVTMPPPPASVRRVRSIPEPNYSAFRFLRDVSLLDLRAAIGTPWYRLMPGSALFDRKPRIRPGILKNYMVVRKVGVADKIHLKYGTGGRLDVRCLTHRADYDHTEVLENGKVSEYWDVIADVSAVPAGQEFEIAVEATYWNGFSGSSGDDYTTYGHEQVEAEAISVALLFPDTKPFKAVMVTEYPPRVDTEQPFQGAAVALVGEKNHTYYWSTVTQRPGFYYRFAWTW